MTSDRMAKLCGDPKYRADAYADVDEAFTRNWDALAERIEANSIEWEVVRLWDEGMPVKTIAAKKGLTLGEVCRMVSGSNGV